MSGSANAGGDSLTVEAVVAARLQTRWLGRSLQWHEHLSSTNDAAAVAARAGADHGLVIVAGAQSAGRGRRGRAWHSPAGENLYLSLLLRPELPVARVPLLSLTAAVGVAEALGQRVGSPPTVKWPNDLLYGGRKVAGILIELSSEPFRIHYGVIGIGINVNTTEFPPALAESATSVALQVGAAVDRATLLVAVLTCLEQRIDQLVEEGAAPILARWLDHADWLGQSIRVHTGRGEVHGLALGLDEHGGLRVRTAGGAEQIIHAGEVELVGSVR